MATASSSSMSVNPFSLDAAAVTVPRLS